LQGSRGTSIELNRGVRNEIADNINNNQKTKLKRLTSQKTSPEASTRISMSNKKERIQTPLNQSIAAALTDSSSILPNSIKGQHSIENDESVLQSEG